ncbi:MAG: dihydroorotate dehydrogenase [Nocardia sp.]|uniref:dihydroorotate dehydrogenase n=1 Tax=Nocardia sp. TaxID=1821 RepID=UPI0026206455|nr:dihydroorotate dehydrogenase [Nocardia sp.]MCU1640744.1 dihydroorotate dehydrogenase [Nocardia sp.]
MTVIESPVDMRVRIGELSLANPVMPASGCFGPELGAITAADRLGAVVTKTIFAGIRSGNPAHRLAETPHGMLNSVGIPSPGVARFRGEVLPRYQAFGVPVIVSVGGLSVQEYFEVMDELAGAEFAAVEVNVSCPNLEAGGLEIGVDPHLIEQVTRGVVARTERPVIVKLTPNVSAIGTLARAAEAGGAAAVTVANTFTAMAVDHLTRRPVLGNNVGGLSGPAIKPLALRLVWETARHVSVPVIGCGGVSTAADAAEFLLAGATAVQVGTASFARPDAMLTILDGLRDVARAQSVDSIRTLTGALRLN